MLRKSFLYICCYCLMGAYLVGCAARQPAEISAAPSRVERGSVRQLSLMGYAIQVGAFADHQNAARLTEKLFSLGIAAYYFKGEKGLYRVRFGNYRNFPLAKSGAESLRRSGVIDEFLVVSPDSYPANRFRDQPLRLREEIVAIARQYEGVPYRLGNSSPVRGFDCSGLAMMVYQLTGFDLPRVSVDQFRAGRPLSRHELLPGDLVFFKTEILGQVSHVGIYLGADQFMHAPSSGKTVSKASLASPYFRKRFLGARSYL